MNYSFPLMAVVSTRIRAFVLVISLFLVQACAAARPAVIMDREPPIVAVSSESSEDRGDGGQQAASVELTVRAQLFLEAGRVEEAVSVLEKAIAVHASNAYAYYYLAKARLARDDYGQTLPLLGKAELYFGEDHRWLSWVHTLRGRTFEALFRWEDARWEYAQAVREDPGNGPAREALARLSGFSD